MRLKGLPSEFYGTERCVSWRQTELCSQARSGCGIYEARLSESACAGTGSFSKYLKGALLCVLYAVWVQNGMNRVVSVVMS